MNLFEMPVLFFALIALALPLRMTDLVIVLLSWVYVALRYLHAGVYATSNDMRYRFGFLPRARRCSWRCGFTSH